MDVRGYIDQNAAGFFDALEREMFARRPFGEAAWLAEAGHSRAAAGEAGHLREELAAGHPAAPGETTAES